MSQAVRGLVEKVISLKLTPAELRKGEAAGSISLQPLDPGKVLPVRDPLPRHKVVQRHEREGVVVLHALMAKTVPQAQHFFPNAAIGKVVATKKPVAHVSRKAAGGPVVAMDGDHFRQGDALAVPSLKAELLHARLVPKPSLRAYRIIFGNPSSALPLPFRSCLALAALLPGLLAAHCLGIGKSGNSR
jgi:hypothetical protein